MLPAINALLATAVALSTTTALACSPVQHANVTFPDQSAVLDTRGALRLGGWLADLKVHFLNYSDFFIAVYTVQNKSEAKALASRRSETVYRFLVERGFHPERVHAMPPIAAYDPTSRVPPDAVEIDFIPACPHGCCDLPTHKVKDLGVPMP